MIKTIVFLVAITLSPAVKNYPHMNHLSAGQHQLVNPTNDSVKFTLDCGEDWAKIQYQLLPRTSEVLYLNSPSGTPAYCFLTKWEPLKSN